jgi:hypothetical protein
MLIRPPACGPNVDLPEVVFPFPKKPFEAVLSYMWVWRGGCRVRTAVLDFSGESLKTLRAVKQVD